MSIVAGTAPSQDKENKEMSNNRLLVFGCPGAASFVKNITGQELTMVGKSDFHRFSAGEIKFTLPESVRGADCWVVQVFNRGYGDDITRQFYEAKILLRTLKDCAAAARSLVMPLLPNTRQEKQWGREGFLFKMMVDELLVLGVEQVIVFDLHSDATASLFDGHCLHLHASHFMFSQLKGAFGQFDVVCGCDSGAAKMAEFYAGRFGCDVAVLFKGCRRNAGGREIVSHKLAGDVRGKKVLMVDELCDTAGTLVSGGNYLIDEGGAREVVFNVVHTILAENGAQKLATLCQRPEVSAYYTTNSVLQPKGLYDGIPKVKVVALEPTIRETILNVQKPGSVGGVYLVQ